VDVVDMKRFIDRGADPFMMQLPIPRKAPLGWMDNMIIMIEEAAKMVMAFIRNSI
jgi:hypothetical protein